MLYRRMIIYETHYQRLRNGKRSPNKRNLIDAQSTEKEYAGGTFNQNKYNPKMKKNILVKVNSITNNMKRTPVVGAEQWGR